MASKQQRRQRITGSAAQRVQIAKDVIEQVEARRFIPTQGVYVSKEARTADPTALVATIRRCKVCAIGSLLISAIDRFDDLVVNNPTRLSSLAYSAKDGDGDSYLNNWFTPRQLEAMEDVFESNSSSKNPKAAMLSIMNNIVRNGGTFVPEEGEVQA